MRAQPPPLSVSSVLLDTGPLVAFLSRRDRYHGWAHDQFARVKPPLLTCESVISEACFLLRNLSGGSHAVMDLLIRGVVKVSFSLDNELHALAKLMSQYANIPMTVADACLVRMSEQHPHGTVLTTDSDFNVYRRNGRQVIPTLMPMDV